ncbi:TPA: hypothetical protein ACS7XC_003700, partial [Providencia alcalifaciens]
AVYGRYFGLPSGLTTSLNHTSHSIASGAQYAALRTALITPPIHNLPKKACLRQATVIYTLDIHISTVGSPRCRPVLTHFTVTGVFAGNA